MYYQIHSIGEPLVLLHYPPEMVMPVTLGLSGPPPRVNWISTWPLALAVVLNVRAIARLAPPPPRRCRMRSAPCFR